MYTIVYFPIRVTTAAASSYRIAYAFSAAGRQALSEASSFLHISRFSWALLCVLLLLSVTARHICVARVLYTFFNILLVANKVSEQIFGAPTLCHYCDRISFVFLSSRSCVCE